MRLSENINPRKNPLSTGAGGIGGVTLITDGIQSLSQNVEDVSAWFKVVIGLATLVAGIFGKDPWN